MGSAVGVVSVAPKIHIVESIGSCASACENKHTCVLCIGSHVGFCCGFGVLPGECQCWLLRRRGTWICGQPMHQAVHSMHGRFQQSCCSATCVSLCCIAEQRQRASSIVVQLGRSIDCRHACCAMQACCARGCKCRLFSRCLGCGHTSCLATVWCLIVYFIVRFGCMLLSVACVPALVLCVVCSPAVQQLLQVRLSLLLPGNMLLVACTGLASMC